MGAPAPEPRPWTRRKAVAAALLGLGMPGIFEGLAGGVPVAAQAVSGELGILIVSRKRLLNDTDHAKVLLKAEIELTAQLQAQVDAVKAELNAEEQELARLRPTLARPLFEKRVAAFDQRVRSQRREAQKKAAALQNAFRAERLKLVRALEPVLERVRVTHGASVILNADDTLVSDPALDITEEALARFNAEVPAPRIPNLASLTLPPAEDPSETSGESSSGQ